MNDGKNNLARYALSADARSDIFGTEVAVSQELWVARQGAGWFAMQGPDGGALIPIWPTRDDVNACFPRAIAGDSFEPQQVALGEFLEKNIPALDRQNCMILAFPNEDGNGDVFSTKEFSEFFRKAADGVRWEVKVRVRRI